LGISVKRKMAAFGRQRTMFSRQHLFYVVSSFVSRNASRIAKERELGLTGWKLVCPLLPPLPYLDIEAHDTVLVAQRHDRHVAGDVVLHLNDLLRRD